METGATVGGRFRLGERLGESRAGVVFAAVDLEESWAACQVEVVAAAGRARERHEDYAAREVLIGRTLAEAKLDGMLPALAWGSLDGPWLYLARGWGDGLRPLDMTRGSLEERAWRLLAAARRVEALAQLGGVHRDLGPATLWEGPDEEVHLGRFGLARFPDVAEAAGDAWGLPFTDLFGVAPELLDAPDRAGPAADAFALGALLHLALVGEAPFPGRSLAERVVAVAEVAGGRAPAPLAARAEVPLPEGLQELCRASLRLDPALRVPTPTAFAERLEDWLAISADEAPAISAADAADPADDEPTEPLDMSAVVAAAPAAVEPPADEPPGEPAPEGGAAAASAAAARPLATDSTARLPVVVPPEPPEEKLQRRELWDPFASGERPGPASSAPQLARRAPAPTEPLLPPVAFDGLEVHDGALVLTARQGLSACVAIVARLDATGFDRLLLDLRGVDRLSAEELGLLADLRLLAEARSLTSGLFGVSAALRPLLVRAGGAALPRLLTATGRTSALAELHG